MLKGIIIGIFISIFTISVGAMSIGDKIEDKIDHIIGILELFVLDYDPNTKFQIPPSEICRHRS